MRVHCQNEPMCFYGIFTTCHFYSACMYTSDRLDMITHIQLFHFETPIANKLNEALVVYRLDYRTALQEKRGSRLDSATHFYLMRANNGTRGGL